MNAAVISQWLGIVIQCGTLIGLLYALWKFAGKGNATQNERLTALEQWRETVDKRLAEGDRHFDDNREANRVTQEALLALLKHAIDGNDIASVTKARDHLNEYLIRK